MTTKHSQWSAGYRTALRKFLAQGARASPRSALAQGHRALALGLEPLDLARSHRQALSSLTPPLTSARAKQSLETRATRYFEETIVPLEDTHGAARQSVGLIQQLTQDLRQRTVETAAATRRLGNSIVRRRAAEAALRKSTALRSRLMKESGRLQKSLQDQTRAILAAQETKRRHSSRQLRDEIAQTLLAISIRLSALKTTTKVSTEHLQREIAETQRLVRQSAKTIQRLAHEFGTHPKA